MSGPEFGKINKFYRKNSICLLYGYVNVKSLPYAFSIPTWFHFAAKSLPKSYLGGVAGRLVGPLAASWAVLRRL